MSRDGTRGISPLSIADHLLAARSGQFIMVHSFIQKHLLITYSVSDTIDSRAIKEGRWW